MMYLNGFVNHSLPDHFIKGHRHSRLNLADEKVRLVSEPTYGDTSLSNSAIVFVILREAFTTDRDFDPLRTCILPTVARDEKRV